MQILFSSTATIDCYGGFFYSNAIRATLPRYYHLGQNITCLSFAQEVKEPKQERIENPNVSFVFLKKLNTLKALLFDFRKNEKIIEQEILKSDLCVVHVPSFIGDTVAKIARKHHKPYFTVVVGCAWDAYWNYSFAGKLIAPFRYYSLRNTQREAAYSIYVTNEFLQLRYPTRGYSIGCSNVNISTGNEIVLQKRMEKISCLNGQLRMGTVAAVNVRYKGQEYVIEALSILRKMGVKIEYHLVGGGDNSFLCSLVDKYSLGNQVIFHGLIPHEQILSFLDDMDLYIQPSKQEGLPRALIEAMSRGCLSIGSKTAGIPELLENKYVFRKGNVDDIIYILSHINKEVLLDQAKRNFDKAKAYDVLLLNKKRSEFMDLFINNIIK